MSTCLTIFAIVYCSRRFFETGQLSLYATWACRVCSMFAETNPARPFLSVTLLLTLVYRICVDVLIRLDPS